MPKGIVYVETRPSSPEREAEFNEWYDQVHLPEVCALPGFLAGRRFAPLGDGGPYIAVYEVEADDLNDVVAGLFRALQEGKLNMSDALQTEPMPKVRVLEHTASYPRGT
ncbi:hypothetical protein ACFS2C_14205 [Prauserella oleivorans]|uniref:Ethyl tert-butyl ether degradation protein EthD n=1 Tax=Prauserella oleivorans TaxID=1478153 RepID=A0ABW5WDY0_9PSEU